MSKQSEEPKRYGEGTEPKFSVQDGKDIFMETLTLPCGATIRNRIAKAPMSEDRAGADGRPNRNLIEMYRAWSGGGFGLCITGNFMVDGRWWIAPGNVVCESERDLEALSLWSNAAQENDTACWAQINHPGRQSRSPNPVAPSAVPLPWGPPVRALTEEEILDVIQRFVTTAKIVKKAGFQGVQIHCAHGYLLSQFLSPLVNQREDQWGGSLENRARISLEILRQTRAAVGPTYPIGVKINSADFQRGGFDEREAIEFVKMLEDNGCDLIEVSGGTYEKLAMTDGGEEKQSTRDREAYFVGFSKQLVDNTKVPVMCTGGWRSRDAMLTALQNKETHLIGLGRPAIEADIPNKLMAGTTGALITRPLEGRANFFFCQVNFDRMAMGMAPDLHAKLENET
mmetsp:Transcript_99707/g.197718  ORF Transcript_99707/g.197718 Transcript_99707/m.197718 type:complete len:398 (+) Transcript_99707:99-1292(+)|eukprot:CAMPEP_0172870994 /NCGR_PEP_ID=MMETSP1075-20121228/91831_1 /TAXON_ID=2916 /ORGANISM="Ceratium fusus, Strain PA161109" /LENGTH=397 /DNA_ID=CAMNT_0013721179 /DNA_START=94 /DNA_END=1287 /DNA_ORIENTATION=+